MSAVGLTSCEDFFNQESEYVIYEGDNALDNAADTIYSVIGVLNKLQAIADRTILLGEVRGDLVDVTDYTHADLRKVASFDIDADNKYNNPRDYYAIINNCNYFIANADTALRNNRNEAIFLREYVAIKGFRAWTYLQLALNYGSVPFVDKPILTKEESEKDYPRYDIKQICNYFINDLMPLADEKLPAYGTIRGLDSRFFYFPIYLLLGELNLWAENYNQAALNYYKYISTRNGMNSAYPIGTDRIQWSDSEWESITISGEIGHAVEEYAEQAELITLIPGDSIPSEGYYSELRDLFNSSADNEYNFSLKPSAAMQNLSASQYYCHVETNTQGEKDTIYAPKNVTWESSKVDMSGDLRLYYAWDLLDGRNKNGDKIEEQSISKHNTRNVHIYRRTMLYLRMAEALNRAGYPVMAYKFLASGVNNKVIEDEVIPCYAEDPAKVAFLRQFDFPTDLYGILNPGVTASETANTIGIHSRGSGWGSASAYYQMPDTASLSLDEQIEAVEDMIVNEAALEFAFEGTRFYDLMRVALRRSDVNYLADRVAMRTGVNNEALRVKLQTQANWYLDWNGEIGIDKE
ncbi:MAG: RagB/SusD family nutrient uptake outer membrane protein [Bacteroidaceae bacterium]|nr:RagB/SusD family nutrient uptake outer membrane protein [Bacteroidaceae bacterium]